MRLRYVLLALAASALAMAGPASSDTVTLRPSVHMLGEWVDGMVFDGSSIWVAETGQSSLAQLNATYGVARRVKLAGAPRKIDIGRDGAIYALIESDDQTRLWQQLPGSTAGEVIAGLEGAVGVTLATGDSPFVWVLPGATTRPPFIRIDPKTAALAKVPLGPGGGGELLVRQGEVWVGIDRLSVVDESTLAVRSSDIQNKLGPQVFFSAFAADVALVYAAIGSDTTKLVVAIDPATLQKTARAAVDQTINAIVADAQNVVAVGGESRTVLAARTLALQRVVNLPVPEVEPRAAMIRNGELLITDFRVKTENKEAPCSCCAAGAQPQRPSKSAGRSNNCDRRRTGVDLAAIVCLLARLCHPHLLHQRLRLPRRLGSVFRCCSYPATNCVSGLNRPPGVLGNRRSPQRCPKKRVQG